MDRIATFSIIGRDPETSELGVAVQSKFLGAGSVVPWARAEAGAIATQAAANLDYGEIGMFLLSKGYPADKVLRALLALDDGREERQIGIVDARGGSVSFTGRECMNWAGGLSGPNFAAQGNILVGEETVKALARTFQETGGPLARRLVTALDRAQDAGGDRRGRQAAGLLVVKEKGSYGGYNDKYIDLRVDDDPEPIKRLIHLLDLHELYFSKTAPEDMLEAKGSVAEQIQAALSRLGYYAGPASGAFDGRTKAAFRSFSGVENFEERLLQGDFVDRKVFEFLLGKAELSAR